MDIDAIYRRDVISISAADSLAEAARRMRAHDVGALLVFEEGKFVGIVTERDLTRAVAVSDPPELADVASWMTDHPITVAPGTGVREAAAEMLATGVRHLPVGTDGEVSGMVSIRDLLDVVVDDATL